MAELAKTRRVLDFEPHTSFTEADGRWTAEFEPVGYDELRVRVHGDSKDEAESNIILAVRARSKEQPSIGDLWKKFVDEFAVEEAIPEEELRERASLVERSHAATSGFMKLTSESFDSTIASKEPVLVDFWAEWCMPCHRLSPILREVADRLGPRMRFAKLNVDENQGLRDRCDILGIPTVIVFIEGQEVYRFVGDGKSADELFEELEPFAGPAA